MSDLNHIFFWWSVLFIIGIINIPSVHLFFNKFTDNGYAYSKTTGVLFLVYLIFILCIFKIVPFTSSTIYSVLVFLILVNFYLFVKNKDTLLVNISEKIKIIIFQEIFFIVGFGFWVYVRGHQPAIEGLEKFMDFGFVNSILRSKYLPPQDMWFAGKYINYYWFGHLVTAVLTKLTNIPSTITYNLMLATIMGLVLNAAFSLVSTLVMYIKPDVKRTIYLAGIISAIVLTFGGNFHTPVYVLKEGEEKYWYPDATRFIGYNPDTDDKTIHEFPIYSFVVSDLHPHLLNLPFVLLFIALLAEYALRKRSQNFKFKYQNSKHIKKSFFRNSNLPCVLDLELRILPLGSLLGIFLMTNTWDFGNYLLLFGITIFVFNILNKKLTIDKLLDNTTVGLLVIATAGITSLPFLLNFDSFAQGIAFVQSRTPIWQLAILWGFPAILTLIFSLNVYLKKGFVESPNLLILSLIFTSWLLILLPEIVYLKDIYIVGYHRANTMFKLTYQAFVMFYLSSGYILVQSLGLIKKIYYRLLLSLLYTTIIGSILVYPYFAIKSYYAGLKNYNGIKGDAWLNDFNPDLYQVIYWFNKNVKDQPVILEAPGNSYTQYNVISSYTGLPTVSGWFVHEWLWRGDSRFPQERVSEITQFYTTKNLNQARSFIKKYKVEYVIVGNFEREKFPDLYEENLEKLGRIVFSSKNIKVYKII